MAEAASRFVTEADQITERPESESWDVALEDNDEMRLVTTLEDFMFYLEQSQLALSAFLQFDVAKYMPDELKAAIEKATGEKLSLKTPSPNQRARITVETIHNLADKLHLQWDDDPDFMAWTKQLTGKDKLDAMTKEELQQVYEALLEGDRPGALLRWFDMLDDAEQIAVERFTSGGFKLINRMLRDDQFEPSIPHLDSALAKGTLKEATIFYRGAPAFVDDLEVGDQFTEKVYLPVLYERTRLEGLTRIMRIEAPKATHGGFIAEEEFLLPRGSTFRVLSNTPLLFEVALILV
jgi:hypothetical protein